MSIRPLVVFAAALDVWWSRRQTPPSSCPFSGVRMQPRGGRLRLKCDCTRAETIFRLSAGRTSPFTLAGASVQSTTGNWGVRIRGSNAGYIMFRGSVRGTGYPLHSPFPLHFSSRASSCAITFQLDSTSFHSYQFVQVCFACTRVCMFPSQQQLAHHLCKMWTFYEPKTVTLWNTRHYVEE